VKSFQRRLAISLDVDREALGFKEPLESLLHCTVIFDD
jgi:hypothetical protein